MTAKHTPERLAIIRATWDQPIHIEEILARLNATPGYLPVTGKLAQAWAAQQGIRRHPHPRRVPIEVIEAPVTALGREPVLRHLAQGHWTYARLERLCDGWEQGASAKQLAVLLNVSKNAVVGKVHRLAKRGLLSARPSPIRPHKGERPRATPVSRPMNAPAPLVTLPPLQVADRAPAPPTRIADAGTSLVHTCQWITHVGSVTQPHLMCANPVRAIGEAWCREHRATVYHRLRAA